MTSLPPSLRPAAEADVPALVEVARRAWLSAFSQTAPFEILQAWFALDREPAWYAEHWRRMTVAVLDGAVAGLVQPADDEVNGLWVHPAHHGRGIGTALLAEAERQIRSAGHESAWLTCSDLNLLGKRFYAARGYAVSRRHTELFGGIPEDVLVFTKPV